MAHQTRQVGGALPAEWGDGRGPALTEHAHNVVYILDAPGLNADIQSTDGDNVLQAIWLKSDTGLVRLSVSLPTE